MSLILALSAKFPDERIIVGYADEDYIPGGEDFAEELWTD